MKTNNNLALAHKKTIGILGGMGPVASANLYYKMIQICQQQYGAEQDHEFPPMLIYNLPLTGFDETGFSNSEAVKEQLVSGVKMLEHAGADFIIIACNTVHYFHEEMQAAVKIPVLNIVDEVIKEVLARGCASVGLLASESTNTLQIYKNKLLGCGVSVTSSSPDQQAQINQVILQVMSGKNELKDLEILKGIIDDMQDASIQGVVLGCTEIPLVIQQQHIDLPLFDSTKIIAEAGVKLAIASDS